jgi:hypothetical protein
MHDYLAIPLRTSRLKLSIVKQMHWLRCAKTC